MNRILTTWVLAATVLLPAAVCGADEVFPVAHNEPITVRVLAGKDGKPLAKERVVLIGGYNLRDLRLELQRQEARTDADGAVRLTNALRNLPLIRVQVIQQRSCGPEGFAVPFSVELIRRDGMSASNRCGTATVSDSAGVLTVFVKGRDAGPQSEVAINAVPKPNAGPALLQQQAGGKAAAKKVAREPQLTDEEAAAVLAWGN
jgi:hypothetical protein